MQWTPKARALAAIRRRLAALPLRLRPLPTMLDANTAAQFIGKRPIDVMRLIKAGKIASAVISGVRLVPRSELVRVKPRGRYSR